MDGADGDRDGPIGDYLRDLHAKLRDVTGGEIATYIPELAKANPDHFGMAIATVDGRVYAVGDADQSFTIQSVSKPFLYGYALEEHGREKVLKHVGVEPTGEAFNSTVLDEDNNRPYNPMVNAGAIGISALVPGITYLNRRRAMLDLFSRFVGRPVEVDEAVFQSERDTGDRNRAIASLMANARMLDGDTNEILDLYFSQCSVLVTCRDLAMMAACLANGGVHPVTGERAIENEYVHDVLTVMNSCGMYNYAGQWSYEVGIPAKSGVSGSVAAVIPGQAGIAAFSPPLDRFGNSVRALAAGKQIAADFGLHVFRTAPSSRATIRGQLSGHEVHSKRVRTAVERAFLAQSGQAIQIIEAQGALFFGSTERLLRRAAKAAEQGEMMILDLRRVSSADAAASALIVRLFDEMQVRGKRMILAHVTRDGPLAGLHVAMSARGKPDGETLFADRDSALEYCENRLLQKKATFERRVDYSLADIQLFEGLSTADLRLLGNAAHTMVYENGQTIFSEGEEARLFFVIAQGAASVRLRLDGGARSVRIATIGAGGTVGEMAMLDGGRRAADVVADGKTVCYGFSIEELKAITETRPHILVTIYANLSRNLSERLRAANREIRALEQ